MIVTIITILLLLLLLLLLLIIITTLLITILTIIPRRRELAGRQLRGLPRDIPLKSFFIYENPWLVDWSGF